MSVMVTLIGPAERLKLSPDLRTLAPAWPLPKVSLLSLSLTDTLNDAPSPVRRERTNKCPVPALGMLAFAENGVGALRLTLKFSKVKEGTVGALAGPLAGAAPRPLPRPPPG